VHKERVPGSRRDYYRMPGNMWDDMLRMRDQVMSRWTALVRECIDLVGPYTPAGQRMAEQADFLEFATKELGQVLGRWQEHRASERADPSDGRKPLRLRVPGAQVHDEAAAGKRTGWIGASGRLLCTIVPQINPEAPINPVIAPVREQSPAGPRCCLPGSPSGSTS